MRTAEQLEELQARFDRDLLEVFGDRTPDLRQPLREMLFELWLMGTKEAINHTKPKMEPINGAHSPHGAVLRYDEATGYNKILSEDEALLELEGRLQTLVTTNGSIMSEVMSTQGMMYPTPIQVMMDPQTGEMFGVDPTNRTKYVVQQNTIKLTSHDGWTWDTPVGEQPPTRSDPTLSHIQVFADGALKQVNVDFNVQNTWTHEEVIQSIFFLSGCLEDTADVRIIWTDFDTSYY